MNNKQKRLNVNVLIAIQNLAVKIVDKRLPVAYYMCRFFEKAVSASINLGPRSVMDSATASGAVGPGSIPGGGIFIVWRKISH